jgi:hypothetical protein
VTNPHTVESVEVNHELLVLSLELDRCEKLATGSCPLTHVSQVEKEPINFLAKSGIPGSSASVAPDTERDALP